MPRFIYTAKSGPQKILQGAIDAESKKDAIGKLTALGYFPISITLENLAASAQKHEAGGRMRIARREIILLTGELASLLESGVNLLKSLMILAAQTPNKYLKAVLEDVIARIKDGGTLSDSLRVYPKFFPSLYTSILHSGEAGGHLDQSLRQLANFLEKEDELLNSVRTALIYPFFILVLSFLTIIILLGFVVPKLSGMFEDMGQILPMSTKILLSTSVFIYHYGWLFIIIFVFLIFLLQRFFSQPQGRIALDRFKLKIPLIGEIIHKTEVSRLTRALSLLLSSGTPVIYALELSSSIVGNQILRDEVRGLKDQIVQGSSLSSALKTTKIFSAFVIDIITVGEEAGTLEKSLLRIADDYEKDVDRSLKTLIHLLEPTIILAMGIVVGFIVISMLLPIFQISLMAK
jgi:type II secretory pathway component PulF